MWFESIWFPLGLAVLGMVLGFGLTALGVPLWLCLVIGLALAQVVILLVRRSAGRKTDRDCATGSVSKRKRGATQSRRTDS